MLGAEGALFEGAEVVGRGRGAFARRSREEPGGFDAILQAAFVPSRAGLIAKDDSPCPDDSDSGGDASVAAATCDEIETRSGPSADDSSGTGALLAGPSGGNAAQAGEAVSPDADWGSDPQTSGSVMPQAATGETAEPGVNAGDDGTREQAVVEVAAQPVQLARTPSGQGDVPGAPVSCDIDIDSDVEVHRPDAGRPEQKGSGPEAVEARQLAEALEGGGHASGELATAADRVSMAAEPPQMLEQGQEAHLTHGREGVPPTGMDGRTVSKAEAEELMPAAGLSGAAVGLPGTEGQPADPVLAGHAAMLEGQAVTDQVVRSAVLSLARGLTRFEMRLQPPGLGRVAIQMDLENGALAIRFRVENEAVRDLLQGSLAQLRDALTGQGLAVSALEVQGFAPDGGHGGQTGSGLAWAGLAKTPGDVPVSETGTGDEILTAWPGAMSGSGVAIDCWA